MSTVDTSTWNPDADFNVEIEGIPLNSDASIAQTWKALRILMAAVKGDGDAIKAMIDVMQGATASADGASGLVPKPEAGDQDKVLKGDGTWGTASTAAEAESVPWSGVTGKPSTFSPSSHAHGSITNDGKLGTASRVVVTDGDKKIAVSSVTATELSCLSGVTSAVQTQLDAKAVDSGVVHKTGNETVAGEKTFTGAIHVQTTNGLWARKATSLERGAVPSANDINYLMWREALTDKDDKICAFTRVLVNAEGRSLFQFVAEKWIPENDVSHAAVFSVGFKPGTIVDGVQTVAGSAFAMCPSTPATGDNTDVLTRDWIPKDTRIVHSTGNETVGGNKTFSGAVRLGSSSYSGIICSADATNSAMEVDVYGASEYSNGAVLRVFGKSNQYNPGYFICRAATSSSVAKQFTGRPDGTLTWDGQPIQTSSDERLKTPLATVPDAVLDAWGDVQWGQFQYLEAVAGKGEAARLHLGLIAQRVKAAFEARGMDACEYGILCHEQRPAVDEEMVVVDVEAYTDDEGVEHPAVTHVEVRHEEAFDLWMVRYPEALAMEAAFQRRRADRLEARLSALEEAMNA